MPQWLYERLANESTNWHPDFAFRNSVRWAVALARLCEHGQFEDGALRAFYEHTRRRAVNRVADNLTFESLLMAAHNLASLSATKNGDHTQIDQARSGTITWYYGIYYAASAMLAASDGSNQKDHAGTARAWGRQIVTQTYVVAPFNYATSTLVKSEYEDEIARMRAGNRYSLNDPPNDDESALGGCISYLEGTASRDREIIEDRIRSSRDFANLGYRDFRTKAARGFRDQQLAGRQTNFLNQAIRYRGKANYRDSIYLSYGQDRQGQIEQMIDGLEVTLRCFLRMACRFAERRVERGTWTLLCDDLQNHCIFSLDTELFRGR